MKYIFEQGSQFYNSNHPQNGIILAPCAPHDVICGVGLNGGWLPESLFRRDPSLHVTKLGQHLTHTSLLQAPPEQINHLQKLSLEFSCNADSSESEFAHFTIQPTQSLEGYSNVILLSFCYCLIIFRNFALNLKETYNIG